MKITQDVRDYASRLNQADVELAKETTRIDPEAGMAEMSRKFRDMGGEVYVDADKARQVALEGREPGTDGSSRAAVKKSNEALG